MPERYITPELKEYEEQILGAEEKIQALETRLYNELTFALSEFIKPIQLNAQLVAQLDVLLNFANLAIRNYYVKPLIDESSVIDIKGGRHPVIENNLPPGQKNILPMMYSLIVIRSRSSLLPVRICRVNRPYHEANRTDRTDGANGLFCAC
jgi:dsDNA-specific endonuclease/ATPase MutS2